MATNGRWNEMGETCVNDIQKCISVTYVGDKDLIHDMATRVKGDFWKNLTVLQRCYSIFLENSSLTN